jgi:hypothetical protein
MSVSKERWRELCRQAAMEKDPHKLVKLCDEINAILQRANCVSNSASASEDAPLPNRRPA